MGTLHLAEIPYEDGSTKFRYARRISEDGARWIRHGLFRAYHPNGELQSEGFYLDGNEHGPWKDYHQNGQMAARGEYENGQEVGVWEYWNEHGDPE
jgi:antitoxin component YwqK of YwqJK toxin-antitoxin module